MKTLSEEIKQIKPFESIEEEVFLNVLQTAEAFKNEIDDTLLVFGINNYQYNVLRILRGHGKDGLELTEIYNRMVNKTRKLSSLCENLFFQGLVKFSPDGEIRKVEITQKGIDILDASHIPIQKRINKNLSFIGSELLEQFNVFLVLARKNHDAK